MRVQFRTNRGDHPAPIPPLWVPAHEYQSWPVINLGWLRDTVGPAAVGRHFVYISVPMPAAAVSAAYVGDSATPNDHVIDGFDSDTLTISDETDLVNEPLTWPSTRISQRAAFVDESPSKFEVRPDGMPRV